MLRRRNKPEEIVAALRQVDLLVSLVANMLMRCQIGVSEVRFIVGGSGFYRWRQEYGGQKTEQIKRLKELELENNRLRKPSLT